MSIFVGSRYVSTPLYVRNGQTPIFNIREKFNFDINKATYYTVRESDTLDGIAQRAYGNSSLYWAILDANKEVIQTELDLTVGMLIAIPSYDEVVKIVNGS